MGWPEGSRAIGNERSLREMRILEEVCQKCRQGDSHTDLDSGNGTERGRLLREQTERGKERERPHTQARTRTHTHTHTHTQRERERERERDEGTEGVKLCFILSLSLSPIRNLLTAIAETFPHFPNQKNARSGK